MADRGLALDGKLTGDWKTAVWMSAFPKETRETLIKALQKERTLYVGAKKSSLGVFGRSLTRKSLWGGRQGRSGGKWSPQMASQFRGKVDSENKKTMDMTLGMGIFGERGIHQNLRDISETHVINGRKKLIIPLYQNMQEAGLHIKTGNLSGGKSFAGSVLGKLIRDDMVLRIPAGSVDYYYLKTGRGTSGLKPIFVGVKSVTVRKQYDFIGSWVKREPAAIKRIEKAVDKSIEKTNRSRNKARFV